jgi:CheY-like chemotaxis protein
MKSKEQLMTFLIVDDHRINLLLIENFLSPYDVEVVSAANGIEAFQIWERSAIDVLITDHYMPLMDGMELIEKIKQSGKQETICMLITGEKNIQSTAYDYLYIKPIVKKEFDGFMSEVMEKLSLTH